VEDVVNIMLDYVNQSIMKVQGKSHAKVITPGQCQQPLPLLPQNELSSQGSQTVLCIGGHLLSPM